MSEQRESRQYLAGGFTAAEAQRWMEAGFPFAIADEWRWYAFDTSLALELIAEGFDDPIEARQVCWNNRMACLIPWVRYALTEEGDMACVNAYVEYGLTVDQALHWFDTGDAQWTRHPDERIFQAHFDMWGAKPWIAAGITDPLEPVRWQKAGIAVDEVRKWMSVGASPEAAIGWRRAGVETDLAIQWIRAGVLDINSPPADWRGESEPLMASDFTAACVRAGLTPAEAQDLDATDPAILRMLVMLRGLRLG